jgi:hypothetical protein
MEAGGSIEGVVRKARGRWRLSWEKAVAAFDERVPDLVEQSAERAAPFDGWAERGKTRSAGNHL